MVSSAGSRHKVTMAPPFTWSGFRLGVLRVAPLLPGVAMYGVAFGVMAQAAGLSATEAVVLSGFVNAGGAQMASLQAWNDPVPVVAVFVTALAMNARYLLLGATLRPWFGALPYHQSYPSLLVMGDGNWVLALREREDGRTDAAFLAGSGAMMWLAWIGSTAAGHGFGQVLGDPAKFGIDFMLAAFFATMAVAFFRRGQSLLPFGVGVAVAILVERLAAGPWYILAGAAAGSAAVAILHRGAGEPRGAGKPRDVAEHRDAQ
jgi:predicted branched-subunit amino acid permease